MAEVEAVNAGAGTENEKSETGDRKFKTGK
jgi:hypothetical protein